MWNPSGTPQPKFQCGNNPPPPLPGMDASMKKTNLEVRTATCPTSTHEANY